MSWSEDAKIIRHPSGKGFAIEVTLTWCGSPYRALITGIGEKLKAAPRGHSSESSVALQFSGLSGYSAARAAKADVEQAFNRGCLGGLWPQCSNCLGFLAINGGRETHCQHCGHDNVW